ncbi:MAG: hypothetical protein COB22_05860 [Cycloclasticus sp.]|nr:MAG: hypothetical protein COB22_05860 [Cycloclasticus sp.]
MIRHSRLAFSLMMAWVFIALLSGWMIAAHSVDTFLSISAWSLGMTLIALFFVLLYEFVLMPVKGDRRNFSAGIKQ